MESFFELLGLPENFRLDLKALEQAYFSAQKAIHPDRFIGKPEAERTLSILRSQQVNDAYETLKNPLTRAEYILQLHGYDPLAEDSQVSPVLLAEMMELRERLMYAGHDGAELAKIVSEIKAMFQKSQQSLEDFFARSDYDSAVEETIRLQYLGKAMEEAHMLIYRLKAAHG